MIFSLLRRRTRQSAIEPLYGAIMARALAPDLFVSGDIPDTFEGRFESVTLHAALVLRRMKALPPPAADAAQELVDRIFDGLDAAMRQVGVSDVAVPKRIKAFAQGFYGRLAAYDEALGAAAPEDRMAEALARNVLEGRPCPPWLARHAVAMAAGLDGCDLAGLTGGRLPQLQRGATHGGGTHV